MESLRTYAAACEEAARAGGQVLRDWAGRFTAREKGPADLVTEADLASQEAVREILLSQFPTHGFLAEENARIPSRAAGLRWIVDPLDGTTNYVHGLANYAVSIALEQHGQLLVGCVYDPVADECFAAAQGQGASLNGRPLRVSPTERLAGALVACSFPARVQRADQELEDFIEVLLRAQAVRRMGSSALNLAYLAAGRFDAYWSFSTNSWDIAAGLLLVQEAGGVYSAPSGEPIDLQRPQFVAAATLELRQEIADLLAARRGT